MEFCCGFPRVARRERNLYKCEDGVVQIKKLFFNFDQNQQTFEQKSLKVIEGFYNRCKGKNKVAKTLTSEKWKALSKYEQNAHTATDCVYCTLFYADVYFSFPKTSEWAREIQDQVSVLFYFYDVLLRKKYLSSQHFVAYCVLHECNNL